MGGFNVLMGGDGGAEKLSLYASLMNELLAERIEQAGAVLADRFAKLNPMKNGSIASSLEMVRFGMVGRRFRKFWAELCF